MRFLTLLARIRVTTYSGSPLIQSFHAYIHMEYSLYSYPFIYIDLYSYVFITNEYTYIHDVTITNKPDSHHHHSGGDNKSEEAGVEVPPTSRETIISALLGLDSVGSELDLASPVSDWTELCSRLDYWLLELLELRRFILELGKLLPF